MALRGLATQSLMRALSPPAVYSGLNAQSLLLQNNMGIIEPTTQLYLRKSVDPLSSIYRTREALGALDISETRVKTDELLKGSTLQPCSISFSYAGYITSNAIYNEQQISPFRADLVLPTLNTIDEMLCNTRGNEWQPKVRKMIKRHGLKRRLKDEAGLKVLLARMKKGRWELTKDAF